MCADHQGDGTMKVKMKYIEAWTEARRANATLYKQIFQNVDGVTTPVEADYARHVYHCFVIRVKNRDEVHRRQHTR